MTDESIGVRVQRMPMADQALVLASIASGRSEDGTFSGRTVIELFYDTSLPVPGKIGNVFVTLKGLGGRRLPRLTARGRSLLWADSAWRSLWAMTPPRCWQSRCRAAPTLLTRGTHSFHRRWHRRSSSALSRTSRRHRHRPGTSSG